PTPATGKASRTSWRCSSAEPACRHDVETKTPPLRAAFSHAWRACDQSSFDFSRSITLATAPSESLCARISLPASPRLSTLICTWCMPPPAVLAESSRCRPNSREKKPRFLPVAAAVTLTTYECVASSWLTSWPALPSASTLPTCWYTLSTVPSCTKPSEICPAWPGTPATEAVAPSAVGWFAPGGGITRASLVEGRSMLGGISSGASCRAFCQALCERNMPQPESSRPASATAGKATRSEVFFIESDSVSEPGPDQRAQVSRMTDWTAPG